MIYEENISKLKDIDFRSFNSKIEKEKNYRDPDTFDKQLYVQLSQKYGLPNEGTHLLDIINNTTIRLSADAIVGIKQLAKVSHTSQEWLSFTVRFNQIIIYDSYGLHIDFQQLIHLGMEYFTIELTFFC